MNARKRLLITCFMLVCLVQAWADNAISFISRSWNTTTEMVESTSASRSSGQYELISGENDEWQALEASKYNVVTGSARRKTLVVFGESHLILCDGATLSLTGGVKLENSAILHIHSQSDGDNQGKLIVTNSYSSTAGIGSARATNMGQLFVHGGDINVTGADYAAGIGGGEDRGNGPVTIYGGKVTARGGKYGAGIGGGYAGSQGEVYIYGGEVTATGGLKAAGIGGGRHWRGGSNGGRVIIYHANVTANGGDYGAGIGGGCGNGEYGNGGHVSIYSGTVTATGGKNAAGIGGGEDGDGGRLNIESGTVTIVGGENAAGVGGGKNGAGGYFDVNVERSWFNNSTTVIKITAGSDCNHAVGAGYGGSNSIVINYGNQVHVNYGNSQDALNATAAIKSVREVRTNDQKAVKIIPCNNNSDASNFDYYPSETYHHKSCKYCNYSVNENHYEQNCPCGTTLSKCHVYVYGIGMNSSTSELEYTAIDNKMVAAGKTYTLPSMKEAEGGYRFVGWLVNPGTEPTSFIKGDGETLQPRDYVYTAPNNLSEANIYARYQYDYDEEWSWYVDYSEAQLLLTCNAAPEGQKEILLTTTDIVRSEQEPTLSEGGYISYKASVEYKGTTYTNELFFPTYYSLKLQDNQDNAELLTEANDVVVDATLQGRTFFHNGTWNTLCLPFDVDKAALTDLGYPLEDATIMEMDVENTTFDESTGRLTLMFKDANTENRDVVIEAGKPYLVKWDEGDNQANPLFSGVLIKTETPVTVTSSDGKVNFVPTFAPVLLPKDAKNTLYVGANNKLYYPAADNIYINVFRACFTVSGANGAPEISSIDIDFGEGKTTGVETMSDVRGQKSDVWHTLDGRKLQGKPAQRGIYILNNKKIVIK